MCHCNTEFTGLIISSPEPAVVPLGSVATFTCEAEGTVIWSINNRTIDSQELIDISAEFADIFVPLPTPNRSNVTINAAVENNGTMVQCLVQDEGGFIIVNMSEVVQLLVTSKLNACLMYCQE